MPVNTSELDKISKLAMLEFSESAQKQLLTDMQTIISYFNKLNEVDTTNVKPFFYVSNLENIFREDKTTPWLTQAEALANAPAHHSGFFSVPRVIK